ncbi:MAG: nuclear transport factor 2 family protein [Chitinophagaceae bacterium]|nr:nuclear transport factor 2 family protein [Chitinophagaceae bacterium]MBK9568973.1 nuclear transport factor 2 family protein [Chitinophagaceae bacterium]
MTKYIFLTAFLISTLSVYAQDNSKTEAEIRALEQTGAKAILKGDTNTLKQLWAPEFLVNTPRNEVTGTRDSILLIQKAGMIDYSIYEKVIERMQFQKNIVITMGHETLVSRNDTPAAKAGQVYKRRFTNIWMKKNGKWQQIARHASIICQ